MTHSPGPPAGSLLPAGVDPHEGYCHAGHGPPSGATGTHRLPRRAVVVGVGAVVGTSLAGCLGADEGRGAPGPASVPSDWTCDGCGMVVAAQPGPIAEVYYADRRPRDHDNPARFCSSWEAFDFDFAKRDAGWSREGFYVTDYARVDAEVYAEGGDRLLTSHPAAAAFVDATTVTFVVGSEVKGAMGEDLVGFSEPGAAEAFAADYGGDLVSFGDVTRDTIAALRG